MYKETIENVIRYTHTLAFSLSLSLTFFFFCLSVSGTNILKLHNTFTQLSEILTANKREAKKEREREGNHRHKKERDSL